VADEIAMFVEAGVSPWAALSAATNGAAEFLGLGDEMGSIAPGRRADLLLLAGNPLDDVTNLRRREGVVLRGLWHPTAVLEGRLARRSAGYVAAKSRFDGIPAPAVDGTTEFAARFEMRNGGSRVNEQRLTIVRSADGERIALGELIEGDMTGVTSVRVRLERGGRSYREEHPGGILMGLLGVIDATRDADELRVTVRPAFGAVVNRTFAVPASAILGSATIATDVLVHDRLGKMRVGEQVELSIVALMPSLEPSIDRWRLLARRTADGPRRVLNRDTIVRNFEITLVLASERVRGSLALDADSHLVEQRLGSQHTVRIE
jgi:hypothetical protein